MSEFSLLDYDPRILFSIAISPLILGPLLGCLICACLPSSREERRSRLHERAAAAYNRVAPQIAPWLAQCQRILMAEGRRGGVYQEGSASNRARAKSVRLIEEALRPALFSYERDITADTYQATEELQRLHNACLNCRALNQRTSVPRCVALTDSPDVDVDLQFQNNES